LATRRSAPWTSSSERVTPFPRTARYPAAPGARSWVAGAGGPGWMAATTRPAVAVAATISTADPASSTSSRTQRYVEYGSAWVARAGGPVVGGRFFDTVVRGGACGVVGEPQPRQERLLCRHLPHASHTLPPDLSHWVSRVTAAFRAPSCG
jgi:hypothetical protein